MNMSLFPLDYEQYTRASIQFVGRISLSDAFSPWKKPALSALK